MLVNLLKVAFVLTSLGIASNASAVEFGLNTEWSYANNPNGPWNYRAGNDLLVTPVSAGPGYGPDPNTTGGSIPWMFRAASDIDGGGLRVNAGDVVIHAWDSFSGASGGGPANILWTSPYDGSLSLTGALYTASINFFRDALWTFLLNDVVLASGILYDVLPNSNNPPAGETFYDRDAPFSLATVSDLQNVAILSGDILEFRVEDPNQGLGPIIGVTLAGRVNTKSTSLPEPPTFILAGIALAGLVYSRRRVDQSSRS